MAATIQIREVTSSVSGYDRTSDQVRFYSADTTATGALTNPITIPTSGSDWSYTKYLRFYMGTTGPSNYVASLKVYYSGTNWISDPTASYVLVEYDKSATYYDGNRTDASIMAATIPPSAKAATMAPGTATFGDNYTGSYFGTYLRLQMEVGNEASPGTLGDGTVTFSYDEQ